MTEATFTVQFNYTDIPDNVSTNVSNSTEVTPFFLWEGKPFGPPLLTVLWTILMVTGVAGNLGFIYVRARVPYMRTLTNYYLVNLGIADTVFLLAQVPGEIWNLYLDTSMNLWNNESYCIVMNLTSYPCQFASLFTLTVIACERYLAICHPFKMSGLHNTKARAFKFILLTWVMGVLVSVPFLCTCNHANITPELLSSLLFVRLVTLVPCMLIIAVLYILIGQQLSKRIHKPGGKEEQVRKERKQVVRMLVVTAAVFFLCMIPQQIYALYTTFTVLGMAQIVPMNVGLIFFSVNKTLMYTNSAANPIIYNVMSSKYRVAFKEAFGPLCVCVKVLPKQKYYYDNSNHTIVTM